MSVTRESPDEVRNQFQQQFQNVFGAMPLSSQIITGVLVVLVLIGLVYLVGSESGKHDELLFGGRLLSEQELDSVEMSFSHAGLNAWKREGSRISVPSETRHEYLSALEDSSVLPISIRSSVQNAIDKTTFLESSGQRLARQEHAKETDLGHKLAAFPDIAWASVEYDLGERVNLGGVRTQSASVVVSPDGNKPLSLARIQAVKNVVRGSYSGMHSDDVVVTDTNAIEQACTGDPLQHRQQEEQARLEQQVREILGSYGPIRVAAYVELAPTAPTEMLPTPEIQVVRRPRQSQPASGGELLNNVFEAMTEVRSNRPTRIQRPGVSRQSNASQATSTSVAATAAIQNVQVSIGLPDSYYHRVWEHAFLREHPTQTLRTIPPLDAARLKRIQEQTETNIRAAVSPAVFAASQFSPRTQSAQSMIQIWTYPDLLNGEVTQTDRAAIVAWLQTHWQQVAFVIMGLLGLLIAAQALRAATTTIETPRSQAVASDSAGSLRPSELEPEHGDLLSLIEQNPDAAASVIRDWVVKAA